MPVPSFEIQSFEENLEKLKKSNRFDSIICIFSSVKTLTTSDHLKSLGLNNIIQDHIDVDKKAVDHISFISIPKSSLSFNEYQLPSRLILAPTGPLYRDQDDVRRFGDICRNAVKRAKDSGSSHPLFIFIDLDSVLSVQTYVELYGWALPSSILAIYAELYEPLEARESLGEKIEEVHNVTVVTSGIIIKSTSEALNFSVLNKTVNLSMENYISHVLMSVEKGRRLAKDVGGSDPERMTPFKCVEYIETFFKSTNTISLNVIKDHHILSSEYPLLWAVARASLSTPRHHPAVVHLEYKSTDQSLVTEELYLVGKGICYDTGGADLKVGGNMVGMSRDKCGASAVAGFFAILSELKPKNINVTADLAFVRNSFGSDSYVSDEIIKSRAGVRVRVGNTDAEGRMVMTDLLAHMKERALLLKDPSTARLFTCATLTGHAGRAVGPYSITMDNGTASKAFISQSLFDTGFKIGDPFEVSKLRREDYAFVAPTSNREDVLQANSLPSTLTARGHQYPMAFMIKASGLESYGNLIEPTPLINDNGNDCHHRLAYTHIDIAGSAEETHPLGKVTGSPIVSFTFRFILKS